MITTQSTHLSQPRNGNVLEWPSQSLDLNLIENLWIDQNYKQERRVNLSKKTYCSNKSKECFHRVLVGRDVHFTYCTYAYRVGILMLHTDSEFLLLLRTGRGYCAKVSQIPLVGGQKKKKKRTAHIITFYFSLPLTLFVKC